MSNEEKAELMHRLFADLRAMAEGYGDPHPQVDVQVIDTDPAPMPGPYMQVTASCRFLLG
jgi:hypothetical protein